MGNPLDDFRQFDATVARTNHAPVEISVLGQRASTRRERMLSYPWPVSRPARAHRQKVDTSTTGNLTCDPTSFFLCESRISWIVLIVYSVSIPVMWNGPFFVPPSSRIVSLRSSRSTPERIVVASNHFLQMVFRSVVRVPSKL